MNYLCKETNEKFSNGAFVVELYRDGELMFRSDSVEMATTLRHIMTAQDTYQELTNLGKYSDVLDYGETRQNFGW